MVSVRLGSLVLAHDVSRTNACDGIGRVLAAALVLKRSCKAEAWTHCKVIDFFQVMILLESEVVR